MAIYLSDDGTLDTVLACSVCGEQFRYNYDPTVASHETANANESYDEFVNWAIEDADSIHECSAQGPAEADITTEDHKTFYQSGRAAFTIEETTDGQYIVLVKGRQIGGTVDRSGAGNATFPTVEAAIKGFMDHEQYWPNCWFISDHGNAHLMAL